MEEKKTSDSGMKRKEREGEDVMLEREKEGVKGEEREGNGLMLERDKRKELLLQFQVLEGKRNEKEREGKGRVMC